MTSVAALSDAADVVATLTGSFLVLTTFLVNHGKNRYEEQTAVSGRVLQTGLVWLVCLFFAAECVLVALGHGLRWWLGWTDRRAATRSAKLDAWQRQLEAREDRFTATQVDHWQRVESELNQLRSQHAALLGGYQMLAAALRLNDPINPALRQADELLKAAFPLDPLVPSDMRATVLAAHRKDDPNGPR